MAGALGLEGGISEARDARSIILEKHTNWGTIRGAALGRGSVGEPAGLDALNSAKYLFLRELSEPRDNSLRLVVEEAIVNRAGLPVAHPDIPELEEISKAAYPIESVEGCRTFELLWQHYVAYLVTEECVGSRGSYEDENHTGTLFRVYTKSHFLDHLARDTGGHTGPIQHFKLICLNHLVDVTAYALPEIRLIGKAPQATPTIQ